MPYLIDGYNLLHAMGALGGRVGPHGLEKARLRLLGLLHHAFPDARPGDVTVIFDAAHAPPGAAAEQDYHGIHVSFAASKGQADELIAELIQHHATPKQLQVISDDHEIQQAARHRHCHVVGCLDFLDAVQRRRAAKSDGTRSDEVKRQAVSASELEEWLQEFGDIDTDRQLGRPFYPYDSDQP
jgi:predicted RNA-binding protein with PIN domain